MSRLSIVLFAAVLASALYLVHVQYQSRQFFTELERAGAEAQALKIRREQLEVEKRALATSLRVEKLAREKLAMRSITPAITDYVGLPAAAVPAPGQEPR